MRIVAFEIEGRPGLGLVEGEEVIDATRESDLSADLDRILAEADGLERLRAAAERSRLRHPLDGLPFRLPVARPGKVLCLGLNYADHAKEGGNPVPDYPAIFMRVPGSLAAHNRPIVSPRVSDKLDYEAELVAIVGRRARHVPKDGALSIIAGYACFNDGSVRDYQRKASQWTMGKNFDATGGFGPWMVTADALPPGAKSLRIESRLNGEVMQSDDTANMLVDVETAVALVTEVMTLEPGDLLVMGTPSGVGYPRNPPVFMRPGDVAEVEIEGIGTLVNPVGAEDAA